MYWFTADTHFGHANIIKYCKRPFCNVFEMNETTIDNWNRVVKPPDTIYILGDVAMKMSISHIRNIITRLNGKKHVIIGDHDKQIWKCSDLLEEIIPLKKIEIDKIPIMLCHYNMRVWWKSHFNSWHCYGHCLDLNTEVLTNNGWKYRNELLEDDQIVTLNLDTKYLEYNNINKFVDYNDYNGNVYNIKSKGLDLRITENHVLIETNIAGTKYKKFLAKDFTNLSRRKLIKSGVLKKEGINISNDLLRLLIWIAADGSISNSNLVRIRIFKNRKIDRIRKLLLRSKIKFSELNQKDGSISFNFNVPEDLNEYRWKPLDEKIKNVDTSQLKILLEEYSSTDGYRNGTCVLIYTSKKIEADIIQEACITNGYQCYISPRIGHGYSKNINYELVITRGELRNVSNTKKSTKMELVDCEHFWCLEVNNRTMMIRRNGKPVIVGNSHGYLEAIGKSYDVGVDNNNFTPISFDELRVIMDSKPNNFNYIGDRNNEKKNIEEGYR